jgi:hypothetical protein
MTSQVTSDQNEKIALVVFGRDEAGKAHASAFAQGDATLATKAAALMNLRVLPIRTEAERALATRVPKGRVFASGKAFVPFIKASLYLELQTAALNSGITPLNPPTASTAGGGGQVKPGAPRLPPPTKLPRSVGSAKQPCGWADIQVGAIVLTMEPPYRDWFEAEVVAVQGEDHFTLRWRDWPELPPVVRRRVQLGLMHPAHQPQRPLDPTSPTKAA